jgi:hypothetical protein
LTVIDRSTVFDHLYDLRATVDVLREMATRYTRDDHHTGLVAGISNTVLCRLVIADVTPVST